MKIKPKKGRFVNVVGVVDIKENTGKILYVNPAQIGFIQNENMESRAKLVIEDESENELLSVDAIIRLDTCKMNDSEGLIQQDIPYDPKMRRLKLLLDGEEVARFDAPSILQSPEGYGLNLAQISSQKQLVNLEEIEPQEGVSYSILVQPNGEATWSAICVGKDRPAFELDSNQFPGKSKVRLRVLQSNGFEDKIITEESISLESND